MKSGDTKKKTYFPWTPRDLSHFIRGRMDSTTETKLQQIPTAVARIVLKIPQITVITLISGKLRLRCAHNRSLSSAERCNNIGSNLVKITISYSCSPSVEVWTPATLNLCRIPPPPVTVSQPN